MDLLLESITLMAFLHWAGVELRRTARWERAVFMALWAWGFLGLPLGLWWQDGIGTNELIFLVTLGALAMPTLLAVTLVVKFIGQQVWRRVRLRR